eukprot:gene4348-6152_t
MQYAYEPQVLVTRGDELPKKAFEKKLHPTYETSIRIKGPDNKKTTPHVVVKFFDEYRTLSQQLAAMGIGEDLPVINISAAFPPSYKSSLLGVKMTEEALQQRCFLLNKWMSALFSVYQNLPPEAQSLISTFLKLSDDNPSAEANKNLLLELFNTKNPPIPPAASFEDKTTKAKRNDPSLMNQNNSADNLHSKGEDKPSSISPEDRDKFVSLHDINDNSNNSISLAMDSIKLPGLQHATPHPHSNISQPIHNNNQHKISGARPPVNIGSSRESIFSDSKSVIFSPHELEEYSKEKIINYFLAVSVLRGDLMAKKANEGDKHHSYEVIVRIQTLSDVFDYPDKDNIDVEEYNKLHSFPPLGNSKVFANYRQLKTDLEACNVYAKGDKQKPVPNKPIIIIDSMFPKTYARSAMGLGLTETQLATRVVMLNSWFGELLVRFSELPNEAKERVMEFLEMDLDNPAEPQNKIYYSILNNTFVPPQRKSVQNGSNNSNNQNEKKSKPKLGGLFSGSASSHNNNSNSNNNNEDRELGHGPYNDNGEYKGEPGAEDQARCVPFACIIS